MRMRAEPCRGLCEAISAMANDARANGREPPVIYTDVFSAHVLARYIGLELGDHQFTRMVKTPGLDHVAMFDGVKIKLVNCLPVASEPNQEWRDHFGILAEIFGDHHQPYPTSVKPIFSKEWGGPPMRSWVSENGIAL
jgi:hypothetical protein